MMLRILWDRAIVFPFSVSTSPFLTEGEVSEERHVTVEGSESSYISLLAWLFSVLFEDGVIFPSLL